MAEIGKKFIQSGKNYEEEFKQQIGNNMATSQVPKATENEIDKVMQALNIRLTPDESITIRAYI